MKRFNVFLPVCLLLLSSNIFAQQFINGSLEPMSGSAAVPCHNNIDWQINTMGYVWKTVDKPDSMYMGEDVCPSGAAKDGHYYLGLYYTGRFTSGNRVVLQLDNYMLVSHTYTFGFWYKGKPPIVGTGASMNYGWADTSVGGTDSVTGSVPSIIIDNNWHKLVITVNPGISTKYIWIGALPRSVTDTGIVFIDKFVMNDSTYKDTATQDTTNFVREVFTGKNIGVYPNPFKGTTELLIGDNITMPCNYFIYDIAGRTIASKDNINERRLPINKKDIPTGTYFLKLTDNNRNTYMLRLVAE